MSQQHNNNNQRNKNQRSMTNPPPHKKGVGNNNRNTFETQKQQKGQNFLGVMNPRDIYNLAERIIRDLARNNIDPMKYVAEFNDEQVIAACINFSHSKYSEALICEQSLMFAMHHNVNFNVPAENVTAVLNNFIGKKQAYSIINLHFNRFMHTRNINELVVLISNVSGYRNYI